MNNCRSFAAKAELSDSERIQELERKLPIFLEKISLCDTIIDKIKSLNSALTKNDANYLELKSAIEKIEKRQTEIVSEISVMQGNIQTIDRSVMKLPNTFQDDFRNDLRAERELVSTQISSLKHQISQHKEKLDRAIEQKDLNTAIDAYKNNELVLHSRINELQDSHTEISAKSSLCMGKVDTFLDFSKIEMQKLRKEIENNLNSKISIGDPDIEALKAKIPLINFQIDTILSCIKEEKNKDQPDFDSIKKEFDKKIENVALDACNATIRTKNSDQKIGILERKIENLDLRLKNKEIA